ncbi:acyltransferase [Pontibacter vulgaris]|uniref:acyltransferase n=1 Tax=Pontibacter vulgaris TaxID=2905679 RepID=UPI0021D44AD2|nr:acyltransferase [Pontibacter vulgaris]
MKKKIRNFIRNIIVEVLDERELCHDIHHNPYCLDFSEGAKLEKPFRIDNGFNIRIGKNSYIGKNSWLGVFQALNSNRNPIIDIKDNVCIGNYACITGIKKIIINDNTLISEYFYASDHTHGFDPSINTPPIQQDLYSKGEVNIGANCFIGYRVSVLPGVSIGKNCVIGAHSVVTKDIPDYSIATGVPAKILKKYSFKQGAWIDYPVKNI